MVNLTDRYNQFLFSILLKNAGASVVLANDGLQGIELAFKDDYCAILMDVQMPNMDGHQATQKLRSMGYIKPIIALTAHAMNQERENCLRSGFSEFLSKPISMNALLEVLLQVHPAK